MSNNKRKAAAHRGFRGAKFYKNKKALNRINHKAHKVRNGKAYKLFFQLSLRAYP